MPQQVDEATTWMYTTEQVRRMLPSKASATVRAIGTRCKRAGAHYTTGWPVAEIEQIKSGRVVTPVTVGTDPVEVYSFDQVIERVADLGWHMTEGNVRYRLQETGTRALRGYTPPDKVREAMERPAGRDWRRTVRGGLAGRTFIPHNNAST